MHPILIAVLIFLTPISVCAWEFEQSFDIEDITNDYNFDTVPSGTVTWHESGGQSGGYVDVQTSPVTDQTAGWGFQPSPATDYIKIDFYLMAYSDSTANDQKFYRLHNESADWLLKHKFPDSTWVFKTELVGCGAGASGSFDWATHEDEWHQVTMEWDWRNYPSVTMKIWVDGELDLNYACSDGEEAATWTYLEAPLTTIPSAGGFVHYGWDEFKYSTDPDNVEPEDSPSASGITFSGLGMGQ
jgi:hypothetical protein